MSNPSVTSPETEDSDVPAGSIGSSAISEPLRRTPLLLALAMPLLACGFAGTKEPWALGAVAALVALNLLVVRPRVTPPHNIVWPLALAALFMLSAFLPFEMAKWPDWRLHFVRDFGSTLPEQISPQPWVSFESWVLAMVGMAWLWTCFGRGFTESERRWLVRWLVVVVALFALLAIIVQNHEIVIPFWRTQYNVGYFGPFPDRNNFSGFLAMGAVLAFAAAYDAWRRRSIFWLVVALCVVCIVWALVSNTSRAGVLLFFGGVVAWMSFASFSRRSAQRIGVSAAIVLMFAAFFVLFARPIMDRMHAAGSVAQTFSNDFRVQIARDTLQLVRQSPWFGVALGNFDPAFAFVVTSPDPYSRIVHPEDDWLWLTAECGLPVLALFLISFFSWGWHTGSWIRKKDSRAGQTDRRLRNACAIAVLMIAVHGLVDVPGHSVGIPFTMILIGALALRPRRLAPISAPSWAGSVMRYGAALFCILAAVMWFLAWMDRPLIPGRTVARRLVNHGALLAKRGDLAGARDTFTRAINISPLQWNYYYRRAVVGLPLGLPPQTVLEDFARMRYLEPNSGMLCMDEARWWLKYHPAYAVPALREAMKRFKERSCLFYLEVALTLNEHPELRHEMRDLASDPKLKLIYLSSAVGDDFNRCLEDLLEQDPRLDTLTHEERLNFFTQWYQKGDRARLIRMLGTDALWRMDGWSVLASDLASKGDFQAAYQLAAESVHPPLSKNIGHGGDLAQLRREFLMHPTDSSFGLELYELEKTKGLFDDALNTLGKLSHLPDAPKRLIYEESVIIARKGDYVRAWQKMNQYIQSSR